MYIGNRKCGHCNAPLLVGEEVVQIGVDSLIIGFTYNHLKCVLDASRWLYKVKREGVVEHDDE